MNHFIHDSKSSYFFHCSYLLSNVYGAMMPEIEILNFLCAVCSLYFNIKYKNEKLKNTNIN